MEGVVELAEEVFHVPVRIGVPQHVTGLSDVVHNQIHSTGVGLLLYGAPAGESEPARSVGGGLEGLWSRIRGWLRGEF